MLCQGINVSTMKLSHAGCIKKVKIIKTTTAGKARTKTLVLLAEFPPEILKSFFSSEPKNSIKLESALLEHSWRNFNLRTFDCIEVLRLKRNSRSISKPCGSNFFERCCCCILVIFHCRTCIKCTALELSLL